MFRLRLVFVFAVVVVGEDRLEMTVSETFCGWVRVGLGFGLIGGVGWDVSAGGGGKDGGGEVKDGACGGGGA